MSTMHRDTSMRAVTQDRYGGPEVMSVRDVPRPVMADDEILVRVQAAEASKSDCEMRGFDFSVRWFWIPLRLGLGVRRPRRPIPGLYFSGVVESVAAAVDGLEPGDEVYGSTGLRRGAYGEYVALPADAVVAPKPTAMTHAEAAALPLGAVNALHFVRATEVGAGDRVLVNGAGGVIGAYAVQIANGRGATVTGVDAAHKEAFVRDMGATTFVDYRLQDVTDLEDRFDVVVDMVPSTSVPRMLDLLAPGGRYAHGNPRLATLLRAPLVNRRGDRRMLVSFAPETRAALREVATMADDGMIRPIVDRVLPMDQVAEAHRLVETEQRIGAIVLAIGADATRR